MGCKCQIAQLKILVIKENFNVVSEAQKCLCRLATTRRVCATMKLTRQSAAVMDSTTFLRAMLGAERDLTFKGNVTSWNVHAFRVRLIIKMR